MHLHLINPNKSYLAAITLVDVKVPYPFGIGNSTAQDHTPCYMDSKFKLTCVNNAKLIRGKRIEVLDINPHGQMVLKFFVSRLCKRTCLLSKLLLSQFQAKKTNS